MITIIFWLVFISDCYITGKLKIDYMYMLALILLTPLIIVFDIIMLPFEVVYYISFKIIDIIEKWGDLKNDKSKRKRNKNNGR